MKAVDLSCDLGEARSAAEQEAEEKIWTLISSAYVACGGHIGDEASMRRAAEHARHYHVQLGAHPSYPDRANFGRKTMSIEPEALRASLVTQLRALREIAASEKVDVQHVKPHGALYNDAYRDRALAEIIIDAIAEVSKELEVVCPAGSEMENAAKERELVVVQEAFGDRRYREDGRLVPRDAAESQLTAFADAAAQVEQLILQQRVIADNGKLLPIRFSTICLHGDMPRSAGRIQAVRERVQHHRVRIASAARLPSDIS
jgi:UPF0271 protein